MEESASKGELVKLKRSKLRKRREESTPVEKVEVVDAHDEAIKPAEKGDDDQAAKPPGAIVAEPPKNSPIPTVNRRISGGLAARLGSLDLSKVGAMGGPRPSVSNEMSEEKRTPKVTSNVANASGEGKVEVDSTMKRAAVTRGGRRAPTKKAFKPDED